MLGGARRAGISQNLNIRHHKYMFSPLELALLSLVGAGLGFFALRLMRPSLQRAAATAPPQAFRTPTQRALHWASMFLLLPPLLYVFGVDGTHFFPVVVVLLFQVAIMQLLRLLGLGHVRRLILLPFVGIASVATGAATFSWPTLRPEELASAPWALLCLSAFSVATSVALSVYSFPLGFGERSR
jgi:hypothetical protein